MTYKFSVELIKERLMNPDMLFDYRLGEVFAHAMEDCFYSNPIHDDYHGGVSLDGIMELSEYLAAVWKVYNLGKSKYYKSALSNYFEKDEKFIPDPFATKNQISYEDRGGYTVISYENVERRIVSAIIWGAIFYFNLEESYYNEHFPARDFLSQRLQTMSQNFEEEDVLSLLFKGYYDQTLKEIQKRYPKGKDTKRMNDAEILQLRLKSLHEADKHSANKDKSVIKITQNDEVATIQNEEQEDEEALSLESRLKIAYVLQLMKISSKEQVKNERALYRVLKALTGVSRTSVQRYLDTFTLEVNRNKDKITDFNKDLKTLGFPQLKTKLICD